MKLAPVFAFGALLGFGWRLDAAPSPSAPSRPLTIYIVPHSHVDIGYTDVQQDIEEKQVNNVLLGIAAAKRTANYPKDARFVWNLENVWPVDLFMRRLGPERRADLIQAMKAGQVVPSALYFNTLTGLCRPEELIDLMRFATQLRAETGVPLDSAMISDVPGYTWGTVTALAQAGIKYFSIAPNRYDRIGDLMQQSQNQPFWWVGPSGKERVLVWVPTQGYMLSHVWGHLSEKVIMEYAAQLAHSGYPYDISYIRWAGLNDNNPPDVAISDFVRDWNEHHASPHLIIGSVHDAFSALERRYGDKLPTRTGDWTPYWEDGAGSSAAETALSRNNSDRLAQANAVWAMNAPLPYPAADFAETMCHLLLYDEHTWGAAPSITAPDSQQTLEEWPYKAGQTAVSDLSSRALLSRALALANVGEPALGAVDILNANSWSRTDLVTLPRDLALAGDRVTDDRGQPVPSQRLTNGELAFMAADIPAYSARRYVVSAGQPATGDAVSVDGSLISNGKVRVALDPKTGGITELSTGAGSANFADPASGQTLNEYLYFNGADAAKARSNGAVTITQKEKGPLVASLLVKSDAPGCYTLQREVTLVAGQDYVRLGDLVDKRRIEAADYKAPEAKESVNFAFPFNVPDGQVRVEIPLGVIRPDLDQIPGACKNWFTVDRWADVSNRELGVTWVSLDAPLVQVGGLTANLLNSQTDPTVWLHHVGPTQKLYAWVMNNHWVTNYRAYQEGPVMFRFWLRPHGAYDPAAASRLAIGASQPLLAIRAHGARPAGVPRLNIESPDVVVTGIKPSDDGRAIIVRLWGAGGKDVTTRVVWGDPAPTKVWLSDTSEAALEPAPERISVPGWGVVTLRADLR